VYRVAHTSRVTRVFVFLFIPLQDMGFEPSIREIAEKLPKERQTLFFTATWPKVLLQFV
jgi:hypothetical protein